MSCVYLKNFSRSKLLWILLSAMAAATVAQAQFSVVYNFGSQRFDPYLPTYSGIVAQGRDGALYSTAQFGGTTSEGAIFKVTTDGRLFVIYSFTGGSDGTLPVSGLTLGTDGYFYGTTEEGGASNLGTVFKVTPSGRFTTLYTFTGAGDGGSPQAPPVQGIDGNFYGTTNTTVYKLTPSGNLTTLYSFNAHIIAPLLADTDGNLYGTTSGNLLYRITPAGQVTILHEFSPLEGWHPYGPLVLGNDGNIYGTMAKLGQNGWGTIFQMTPKGKVSVIHSFDGSSGGAPFAGLVQSADGTLYGSTIYGGTGGECETGCGTLFQISPHQPYSYQVLYNFDYATGALPQDTLIQHTNGILYADTEDGGSGGVYPCVGDCGVFYSYDIGAAPFIAFVGQPVGNVGKEVEILGQGFTGLSSVSFNGIPASFTLVSDTFIKTTVPSGATSGFVTVTTPSGALTSKQIFVVKP